jgi:hypothetical protein
MSDIKNTSASKNKNFDSFSLTDNIGNSYLFVRSTHGFSNIARYEVQDKEDKPLLCHQKSFNDAIEVVIKMLDRLDHYDRVFAQE